MDSKKDEEEPSADSKKDEEEPSADSKSGKQPSMNPTTVVGDQVEDDIKSQGQESTTTGATKATSTDDETKELKTLYPDWESHVEASTKEETQKLMKEQDKQRDKWKNSLEFILSSVSSAVGLGNIWRFSQTALQNGGGAFLIPYLILVVLIARPLYYLEAAVGQFSSRGAVGIWDMAPIFRGVGWAMSFLSAITVIYYTAVLAFCGAYLIFGMQSTLPWKDCDASLYVDRPFLKDNSFHCEYSPAEKKQVARFLSSSTLLREGGGTAGSPLLQKVNAELYFQYYIARQKEDINDGIGTPLWHLAIPLLVVWILILLNMILGTKSSGKAAYFTAIFPYVVLLIFLGRACSLKGAGNGIRHFFTPKWEEILRVNVWVNALNQCLFSLGIGYGNVIAYGSFNGFRQKLSRDALIVSSMDTFTSLLAGVTVFATLGVLAEAKKIDVAKVANGGFSLLFVSYPEVLLNFGSTPFPQIFSFLFFAMLITLGVGSAAAYFHTVMLTILDTVPKIGTSKLYKILLTVCLCIIFFLLGIPMTTPGGVFVITLLDQYAGAFICYLVVLCELIGIAWIYGMKSFMKDICFMTNSKPNSIPAVMMTVWGYCMPVVILGVIIAVIVDFKPPTERVNGVDKQFPTAVLGIGTALPILMALMIPGWGIYVFFSRKTGSWYKKYMASRSPNNKWGPKDPTDRNDWVEYKKDFDDRCWLYKKTISRCCPEKAREGSVVTSVVEEIPANKSQNEASQQLQQVDVAQQPGEQTSSKTKDAKETKETVKK